MIDPDTMTTAAKVYCHQLASYRREAQWRLGQLSTHTIARKLDIVNQYWLQEVNGAPTVLVAPFQTYTSDAIAIAKIAFGERSIVFYGEEFYTLPLNKDVTFVGPGLSGIRTIHNVLRKNQGVFCTYPDFVYEGHATLNCLFFGTLRPFSLGFLQIAARSGYVLLPACTQIYNDEYRFILGEPMQLPRVPDRLLRESANLDRMLQWVAASLEASIAMSPEQWLLLLTLTAPSPQFARA